VKIRLLLLGAVLLAAGLFLFSQSGSDPGRARREGGASSASGPAGDSAGAEGAQEAEDAPALLLRVVVRDRDEEPVEGATVARVDHDWSPLGGTVETGADGRCTLPLPESADGHAIGATHPGHVAARGWVPPGHDRELVLVLGRGAPLSIVALAHDKSPVEGASVRARHALRHGTPGMWTWVHEEEVGRGTTDAEGRVRLGAAPEGDLDLEVDHPGFALYRDTLEIRGFAPREEIVVLNAGGALEGRVFDPEGEPVAGATVRLDDLPRPETKSAADGTFRLEHVGAGTVSVVAEAAGFGPGFFGERLGWGQPVPVTLQAGHTVTGIEIVLGKPTFVVGRIVDDQGKPVKGVVVNGWARYSFGDVAGTTAADGRFRIGPVSLREKGQLFLWFNAMDHVVLEPPRGVATEPGKDVDVGTLKAARKGTVRGVVIDLDGTPARGGTVRALPGARYPVAKDGTFSVPRVKPGRLVLQATTREPEVRRSAFVPLEVAVGEVKDGVEIRLRPTGSIEGRVVTRDGEPRVNMIVAIRVLDAPRASKGPTDAQEWTDEEGRFEFEDLPEARYQVGITGSGSSFVVDEQKLLVDPAPVEAEPGGDPIELVVPLKGALVKGKVVSRRDQLPLRSFRAMFIRYKFLLPSGADDETFNRRDGTFFHELEEAGTWAVEISAPGYASYRTKALEIGEGETRDLGTIRLGDGGTIRGVVRDARGQPVAYARINILNAKFQTNEEEPFTDLEGGFELEDVSPGPYTVFAVSPRHPLGLVRNVVVKEGEETKVAVDFLEPAPLTFVVTDEGGNPIEGASMAFTFPAIAPLTSKLFRGKIPPGYGSHESDPAGLILQHSLPPGEVTISIEKEGFRAVTRKLALKAGEANRVEVRMTRE